jgi:hypothetical protein
METKTDEIPIPGVGAIPLDFLGQAPQDTPTVVPQATPDAPQDTIPIPLPPIVTPEYTGVNLWNCPVCGKGPHKFRSYLARHIRDIHTDKAAEILAGLPDGPKPGPRKPNTSTDTESPPDFSDLGGEPIPPTGDTFTTPPVTHDTVNYHAMSEMLFDMSTGLLSKTFGPEWQPSNEEERGHVISAIELYARTKQLPDLPPGYMLCFVIGMYSLPRLAAPTTKSKLFMAWLWLKSKVFRKKSKE